MQYFKTYEYGEAVKGTMFIFAGWRMIRLVYLVGIKRTNKAGYKCVFYMPSPKLLGMHTPVQEFANASEKAVALVNEYIENDTRPNQKYLVMGTSLGAAFAPRVAKECPAISSLILVSTFGDVEEQIDLWYRHRHFGKVARSQASTREEAVQVLRPLMLTANLDRLKGKPILIGYGLDDKLLHTHLTEAVIAELRANDMELITKSVPGGHFGSMFKLSLWFQPKKLYFFD